MKAEMFNDARWIEDVALSHNPHIIKSHFTKILSDSGFTILRFCDHRFEPYGYTALWLLSESHLAIHTFPEENKLYVEMSSCVLTPFEKYVMMMNDQVIYPFEHKTTTLWDELPSDVEIR